MAFSSDLVRTKNWGTEILIDTDLEGQLDLIIDWIMAALNSSTGHGHEGTSNKGPKINVGTGLAVTNQAQGDVLYASSASAFARLGAGTKGKCLTTGGVGANPTFEGMTTQGDVEYHDGTNRARLEAGNATDLLGSGGIAANPSWKTIAQVFTNVVVPKTYDSGWFACAVQSNYSKTHNLGTTKVIYKLYFATDDIGTAMVEAGLTDIDIGGGNVHSNAGGCVAAITTTTLEVHSGGSAVAYYLDADGDRTEPATGFYRVVAIALA